MSLLTLLGGGVGLTYNVGSFAANTSTGNQAVVHTGLTTTPKILIMFANRLTAAGYGVDASWSFGCATATDARWALCGTCEDGTTSSDTSRFLRTDRCISFPGSAGGTTADAFADFVSFDADAGSGAGFTINWDDAPASGWLVHYVLIGGTDITAQKAGSFTLATSGGTQAFTDPAFQPDFLLLASNLLLTSSATGSAHDIGMIGFANSASSEYSLAWESTDALADSAVASAQRTEILQAITTTNAYDSEADLASFDTNGFTLTVSDLPSSNRTFLYLAVKGGIWEAFTETQRTSTGTKAKTLTLGGATPAGVFLASTNQTNSAVVNASARKVSWGASDGTNEGCIWHEDVDAAPTMDANCATVTTKAIRMASSQTTTDAEADAAFSANTVTLDWTTADATARELVGFAVAPGSLVFSATVSVPLATISVAGVAPVAVVSKTVAVPLATVDVSGLAFSMGTVFGGTGGSSGGGGASYYYYSDAS